MVVLLLFVTVVIVLYFLSTLIIPKKKTEALTAHVEPIKPIKPNNPNAEVHELQFFCIKDKGRHVSVWPKDVHLPDYIEFNIAGISHHREAAMKHLGESMALLVAEPDNQYDPNAIKIMTADWDCLGYVPKDMTDEIRSHTKLSCPCLIYIGYNEEADSFYTDAYVNLNYTNK